MMASTSRIEPEKISRLRAFIRSDYEERGVAPVERRNRFAAVVAVLGVLFVSFSYYFYHWPGRSSARRE